MAQDQATAPSMYCRKCNYQLLGLSENRCPECGRPFDPADRRTFYPHTRSQARSWWIKRIAWSLATAVLLAAIFIAACFAWVYRQYHPDWQAEQQAISALRGAAPNTSFAYAVTPRSNSPFLYRLTAPLAYLRNRVWWIKVTGPPRSGVDLGHLAAFKQCDSVSLVDLKITDDQLKHLEHLTRLTWLSVTRNALVTDGGLVHLRGLTSLGNLELTGTSVTGTGFKHLRRLTRLRYLSLEDTPIQGGNLLRLTVPGTLKELLLENCPITDADLVYLKALPLECVILDGTRITDAGMAELGQMVTLQVLHIRGTAITDAGLQHLSGLRNLFKLALDDTAVSDAGLQHLMSLPNLQYLYVSGTKATSAGLRELRQKMPALREAY